MVGMDVVDVDVSPGPLLSLVGDSSRLCRRPASIVTTGLVCALTPTPMAVNTSVETVVNGLASENGSKIPSNFGNPSTSRPAKADQVLSDDEQRTKDRHFSVRHEPSANVQIFHHEQAHITFILGNRASRPENTRIPFSDNARSRGQQREISGRNSKPRSSSSPTLRSDRRARVNLSRSASRRKLLILTSGKE